MRQRRPVSSSTSRKAAASIDSPGSSLPLGNDQSLYFGRCTSRTRGTFGSRKSMTRPPAATISSNDSISATVTPEKGKRQKAGGCAARQKAKGKRQKAKIRQGSE